MAIFSPIEGGIGLKGCTGDRARHCAAAHARKLVRKSVTSICCGTLRRTSHDLLYGRTEAGKSNSRCRCRNARSFRQEIHFQDVQEIHLQDVHVRFVRRPHSRNCLWLGRIRPAAGRGGAGSPKGGEEGEAQTGSGSPANTCAGSCSCSRSRASGTGSAGPGRRPRATGAKRSAAGSHLLALDKVLPQGPAWPTHRP